MAADLLPEPTPENPSPAWTFKDEAASPEVKPPLPGYRPGGLTAICILAIILGVLGLMTGLSALLMGVVGNQVQTMANSLGTAGSTPEVRNVQAEMNAKMMEVVNRYRLVNVALAVVQLAISGALIYGGVQAIQMKESGRTLLAAACGAAIVFELCRAIPHVMIQLENLPLMEEYFPRIMEASTPGAQAEQIAAFSKMLMRFSTIMGWVVFGGWLILKLAFYAVAFSYLRRPNTRALYATR